MEIIQISARIAKSEFERLEQYCESTARSKTEVIRELIRTLPSENTGVQATPTATDNPKT